MSGHIWGCVFKLIELHLSECGIKEEGHGPQTWHTDTSDHKELFGRSDAVIASYGLWAAMQTLDNGEEMDRKDVHKQP